MIKSSHIQHVIVYLSIAVGIFITVSYKTELDKLLEVQPIHSKEEVGIREMKAESGRVEPQTYAVPRAYTILYFYSNSCPACKRLNADIEQFSIVRPDVAVLKFDLGYDWSGDEAYNAYRLRIGKTPFIHIYDPSGRLVVEDIAHEADGLHLLREWMTAELHKAWN